VLFIALSMLAIALASRGGVSSFGSPMAVRWLVSACSLIIAIVVYSPFVVVEPAQILTSTKAISYGPTYFGSKLCWIWTFGVRPRTGNRLISRSVCIGSAPSGPTQISALSKICP
jgi:hypothetical protein